VSHGRTKLGSSTFRLAAGKTVSVRLKAKHARGKVTISIALNGGGSLSVSRKL
jgi:hypothetical protein